MARQKPRRGPSPWFVFKLAWTIVLAVVVGLYLTPILYDMAH
jgi:hypothetical protein